MKLSTGRPPSSGPTRNSSNDAKSSLNGSLYDLDVPIAMAEFATKYFRYHQRIYTSFGYTKVRFSLIYFYIIFLFHRAASTDLPVSEMIQHTPVRVKKWNTHLSIPEVEVTKLFSKE